MDGFMNSDAIAHGIKTFDHSLDGQKTRPAIRQRFVGFPSIGSLRISEKAYQNIVMVDQTSSQIMRKYLSDSDFSLFATEDDTFLPSFSFRNWDLSMESNVHGEGPTWQTNSQPIYFDYVLYAENRCYTHDLLYGNSSILLTWAAVNFVYGGCDKTQFRDRFFETLVIM